MDKHRFVIKRAKRQSQVVLLAFGIEHIISLTFFLMGGVFDGFYFALVLITAKTLTEAFFGLLPQLTHLLLQYLCLSSR